MPDGASHPLFPAAPRPDQAVAHPAWRAALAEVEGSLGKPGLIAVTGPPGSGKTLLLHAVAERVLAAGGVAALFQPAPVPGSRRPDVVLIDDAGRLTASMLRALAQQGRPMVVAGGEDLAERLRDAGVPAAIVTLGLLAPDDAAAFLRVQLAAAERPADLIQPAALMQLVQRSHGVPRNLQMLAGLSVFVARLADAPQVTPAHVEQAALIQTGTEPGDDDADAEDDGPVVPRLVRRPASLPAPAAPLPVQPVPAPPATPAPRRLGGWTMAALALGALGAGAGIGWLLIPYVSPWLLALSGHAPGPVAERPPASLTAADPRPVPARPSVPQVGAGIQPAPRPATSGPGQPVPLPAAPAAMASDPAMRQPPADAAPPPAAAPAAPSQQILAVPAPALSAPQSAAPVAAPAAAPDAVMQPAPGPLAQLGPPAGPVRPAVQALPLPPPLPLHVVILYESGNSDADAQAASLAEELGQRGYQVPPPEPGAVRGDPTVSYVFAEDAPAAAALAHAIGVEATHVRPGAEPRPGAIRVVVTPAVAGQSLVNLQPTGNRR